jgi:CheY-like chemotaxis protein
MIETEPITILLAEDDDGHAVLIERNLTRAGLINSFKRFRDGKELFDFLEGPNTSSSAIQKGSLLLILDLKMPRLGGIETLERLKNSPRFSRLPVIMLTTTDDPREIARCYERGCSVYITKPVAYDSFIEAIRRLGLFLQIVKFPEVGPSYTSDRIIKDQPEIVKVITKSSE